jgi:hypothetical protein
VEEIIEETAPQNLGEIFSRTRKHCHNVASGSSWVSLVERD